MVLYNTKNTYLFLFTSILLCLTIACSNPIKNTPSATTTTKQNTDTKSTMLQTGAERTNLYLQMLDKKNVAVVANQTSIICKPQNRGTTHLIDTLLALNVTIKTVFVPEHGFRGQADAGENVKDGIDPKTKVPITSLYGKNKKPTQEQLKGIDVVVFDLQDVGVRFYTYISTLHYVMEACAENNIPLLVLDRPNPNAHYIDGPVLEPAYKSFIGMHPVPVVYGMTIGEYARMINGEQWLANNVQCNLTIIPLDNYNHQIRYRLPVKPSPNLPNNRAVNLYPSLCFFEGTTVSCGRGTDMPFQIYGAPYLKKTAFSFVPKSNDGAKHPKHLNKRCYGKDLRNHPQLSQLNISWLIETFQESSQVKTTFWRGNFFTKLAGTKKLQQQIMQGYRMEDIQLSWQEDLKKFKRKRKQYLLYD